MPKTALGLTLLLALAPLAAPAAPAIPSQSRERVEIFATCSGRLAALVTRQKALGEAAAAENDRLRAEFDLLVDAILPDALADGVGQQQPDRWRIDGWSEIALLLAAAEHGVDPRRADTARLTLTSRIETCTDLLL